MATSIYYNPRHGQLQRRPRHVLGVSLAALLMLSGCANFDPDLRGRLGGLDTGEAVQADNRPAPDERGVITYPNYQVAVARRGDSVASIAARLGINADQLGRENGLPPSAELRAGEVLRLPVRVSGAPAEVTPVSTEAVATSDLTPVAAPEPATHRVERGETAYGIARRYGVSVQDLAAWNGLDGRFTLREGQTLLIPTAAGARPNTADRISLPGQGSSTPTPPTASQPLPDEATPPVGTSTPTPAPASTPAPSVPDVSLEGESSSQGQFDQPVPGGVIIRDYAPGTNDGLDISAAPGTPVRAAQAGTVAALTKDADGVPILVIRHSGGLLSVYANITNITVANGERVSRGQQIAALRDQSPAYLHFEIRDGFESVDPTDYLR